MVVSLVVQKPDGAFPAAELGRQGAGVGVLDTHEAYHHGHVRLEGLPEAGFDIFLRRHGGSPVAA